MWFYKVEENAVQMECQGKSWVHVCGNITMYPLKLQNILVRWVWPVLNEQLWHCLSLLLCLSRGLFDFCYQANPWIKDV